MIWPFNVSVPLFRSEDMSYVSVTVTNDAAYETLMEIGKFGRFHFVDVTTHRTHPPTAHTQERAIQSGCAVMQPSL